MILLPFPRRVGPTAEPLFSPRRTWRRQRLRRDRFCRGPADLRRAAAGATPAGRIVATAGSDDDRSDTADTDVGDRATAHRCARSRGRRSARHAGRSRVVRVRRVADADEKSARGRPTACRSNPCQRYDSPARIVTLGSRIYEMASDIEGPSSSRKGGLVGMWARAMFARVQGRVAATISTARCFLCC